jgi:bacterioferritin
MKGNSKVLAELNKALREELTAINQYFLHAEMCENWGYHKLADLIKKQSIGEMKHAEVLMERILFLDGSPSMEPLELSVGKTVKDMIESDLALELGAVKQYNEAVAIATREGDNGSRDLLVELLKDEEDHVDFLEAQLHQIKELGYERYLAQQIEEAKEYFAIYGKGQADLPEPIALLFHIPFTKTCGFPTLEPRPIGTYT